MRFINFCRHKCPASSTHLPKPDVRLRSQGTDTCQHHHHYHNSRPPCHAANVNNNADTYCCVLHNYARDSLQLQYPRSSRQTVPVVQLIMNYTLYSKTVIRATIPEFKIVTHYPAHHFIACD